MGRNEGDLVNRGRCCLIAVEGLPTWRAVWREPTEMNIFEVNGHKDCRFEKHRRLGGFTPSARPGKGAGEGWRHVSAERNANLGGGTMTHAEMAAGVAGRGGRLEDSRARALRKKTVADLGWLRTIRHGGARCVGFGRGSRGTECAGGGSGRVRSTRQQHSASGDRHQSRDQHADCCQSQQVPANPLRCKR